MRTIAAVLAVGFIFFLVVWGVVCPDYEGDGRALGLTAEGARQYAQACAAARAAGFAPPDVHGWARRNLDAIDPDCVQRGQLGLLLPIWEEADRAAAKEEYERERAQIRARVRAGEGFTDAERRQWAMEIAEARFDLSVERAHGVSHPAPSVPEDAADKLVQTAGP